MRQQSVRGFPPVLYHVSGGILLVCGIIWLVSGILYLSTGSLTTGLGGITLALLHFSGVLILSCVKTIQAQKQRIQELEQRCSHFDPETPPGETTNREHAIETKND